MAQPAEPAPSRRKTAGFAALAAVLPVVLVLLLEGALRLAGVGAERREPFVPIPDREDFVALAPGFGASFFRGFTPGVAFDPLAAEKPEGRLRVVALGGSTTAGFPYHFYYGFPARLEDRLAVMRPGAPVEVANLGMTATNSYTLWALAEPVARLRPDAVVIYSGHNEYYGAFGTGGTQGWTGTSLPLKRFGIRAGRWALVSGISGLVRSDEAPGDSRTLMARVVRESAIAPGGEVFDAGVAQYEANLRDALEVFGREGVPVYLATLASNLSGQAPLGDEPEALAAFERGQALLAAGDSAAAREAFLEAKEADGLRFRAPEAINAVVRQLAAEFDHVTLVDVAARVREASPGGVEGDALFTDHLHPNARGYALLADAFAGALRSTLPALADAPDPGLSPADLDPVEDALARLQLTVLTSGYPFDKDRTPAEAEAIARDSATAMMRRGGFDALAARVTTENAPMPTTLDAAIQDARARPDSLAVLRLYQALLHWQPFNQSLTERAVSYAIASPAYDEQTAALARYASTHSARAYGLNALGAVALRTGDLAAADAALRAAEAETPDSPEVLFNRARLLVLQGDTTRARGYFERFQATQR